MHLIASHVRRSTVKVVTVPDKEVLTFVLCGAQSPSVRRNPEGGFTADPYGMDARALTESLVLNRCAPPPAPCRAVLVGSLP